MNTRRGFFHVLFGVAAVAALPVPALPAPGLCVRKKPHDGPCNGYQTAQCLALSVGDVVTFSSPGSALAKLYAVTAVVESNRVDLWPRFPPGGFDIDPSRLRRVNRDFYRGRTA
jgi:hypothetical protein